MEGFFNVDWHSMFVPTESVLEVFLRGTILYLSMFVLLRVFRRQAGSVSLSDLLVIVVIADAAQNGMAGDSKSVTEALLLVATIILWNYLLDYLGFKSKFIEKVLEPERIPLIEDGRVLRKNMRSEMITVDELESQMRQNGIDKVEDVEHAALESDGHFSFIKKSGESQEGNGSKNRNVN